MTELSVTQSVSTRRLAPADLGGPGAPLADLCAAIAIAALRGAAGSGFRMTSLALDVASHPLGSADVEMAARVDKRARSIVFASVEARSGERLVFSAQGLFSAG